MEIKTILGGIFSFSVWVAVGVSLPVFAANAKELATVNGVAITDKDLNRNLSGMTDGQRASVLRDTNTKRQLIQDLIDREVISQEAQKLKLDQDAEFNESVELFKKQLMANRLLERKLSSQMTEAAERKYYHDHKYDYSTDRVHVQQILSFDEAQAKKILALASDPKNDFQDLAEKYSKDPSAKNNRGDLGFIGRDHFVPEFTEAAMNTPVGSLSAPIKTSYGYHIIKVIEKRIGKPLEFDEVQLQVRAALHQELIHHYAERLRAQAKITLDNAAIERN